MEKERLSKRDYYVNIVNTIAERSTCNRGKPGCIFVKDDDILVTGYAGSLTGFPHCDDVGHIIEQRRLIISIENANISFVKNNGFHFDQSSNSYLGPVSEHCIRTIHAEQIAIARAAKRGVSLKDSTCYVSLTPCRVCTMLLVAAGVKEVVAIKKYQKANDSINIFNTAGIEIIHLDEINKNFSDAFTK